jgi:hypothetical protein
VATGFTPISRLDADPFHICRIVVAPIFIMCASPKGIIFQRPPLYITNYLIAKSTIFITAAGVGIGAATTTAVTIPITVIRSVLDFKGYQDSTAIV